ncbi:MAG: glycosyltransferase family 2 protein [Saprospiraceae bacterium]|nr:glycosyltransferase family 2 protein [Saprospiraceae bacterium]
MKLSIVIPAHNEAESLPQTISSLHAQLQVNNIEHEILVINDHSTDKSQQIIANLQQTIKNLVCFENEAAPGYGMAVRYGLEKFSGDCVAIMMADQSDDPEDLVRFFRKMEGEQLDCVFGSRFMKGGQVDNYPKVKLMLNRFANYLVKWVFRLSYNDCTNAFKLYKRETIEGIKPLLSPHFNLTLEMPLKAIVRGYSYTVLPNKWTNRRHGKSNLRIKEMGSRYFFIFLYCLIEKYFSKGDYRKE